VSTGTVLGAIFWCLTYVENSSGQAQASVENMKFIRTLAAGNVAPALKAGSLVPASPAVIAAAKDKNDYEDNDDKCGVVHVALL
jgi:hypothetical protein